MRRFSWGIFRVRAGRAGICRNRRDGRRRNRGGFRFARILPHHLAQHPRGRRRRARSCRRGRSRRRGRSTLQRPRCSSSSEACLPLKSIGLRTLRPPERYPLPTRMPRIGRRRFHFRRQPFGQGMEEPGVDEVDMRGAAVLLGAAHLVEPVHQARVRRGRRGLGRRRGRSWPTSS